MKDIDTVHYGDSVKIKAGFYKGQTGEICSKYGYLGQKGFLTGSYGWKIKLNDGREVGVDQFDIEE